MDRDNRTMTQKLIDDLEALNRRVSHAIKNSYVDGFVPYQIRLMQGVEMLRHGIIHYATQNGMEPHEIESALGVSKEAIEMALATPFSLELEVGALVESKNGDRDPLRCGAGCYANAVVISIEPFIMVSGGGDMRWSTWTPDRVQVVGRATPAQLEKAMLRLEH